MKRLIAAIVLFHLMANTFCQSIKIPDSIIYKYGNDRFLLKEDSLIKVYDAPLTEVHRLYINIDNAFFDRSKKVFKLKGRICYTPDTENCLGVAGVKIFKSERNEDNILSKEIKISESSYVKGALGKDGFFDVKFKIEKGESLYFYAPGFYLEEFKLDKLINKAAVKKKEKPVHHQ